MTWILAALAMPAGDLRSNAEQVLGEVVANYRMPNSALYAERPDLKQPAFNWGVGVMLSALNAAARADRKHQPALRAYAEASLKYWNDGGFDVLPAPKPKDRYYDDNAWMALAYAETAEVLKEDRWWEWSKRALDFALQGESPAGGVFWRESDHASRNTCSNAPTAAACVIYYRYSKDPRYLEAAKRLYQWTSKTLRDPADGLYWDNINTSGVVERTKWSYNSALMIRTAKLLRAEGVDTLGWQQTLDSAEKRWLKDGSWDDPGRFAHLLLEALMEERGPQERYIEATMRVFRSGKGGFYPPHWRELKLVENPEILDQAALARALFELARTKVEEKAN